MKKIDALTTVDGTTYTAYDCENGYYSISERKPGCNSHRVVLTKDINEIYHDMAFMATEMACHKKKEMTFDEKSYRIAGAILARQEVYQF